MEFFGTPVFSRAVNFREYSFHRKKRPDVFLNIFILQDRTAILMGYLFMLPESGQDSFWLWILM